MPYFLMTGILIVFALEVGVKKLHVPEKEPAGHSALMLPGDAGTTMPADCCYFYSQGDEFPQKDFDEHVLLPHPYSPPPCTDYERRTGRINDFLNTADHHNHYFGLSPPCMLV